MNESDIRQLFRKLDINSDGQLTQQELMQGMRTLRLPAEPKHVRKFTEDVSRRSPNGKITEDDFVKFALSRRDKLKKLFDELDTNKTGTIGPEEIRILLTKMNLQVRPRQVRALIKRIQKRQPGKGSFDFREFCEFIILLPVEATENVKGLLNYWQIAVAVDVGEDFYIPPETGSSAIKYVIAGGVAGAVSRTCTAPLDRLKILLQTQGMIHNQYSGVVAGLRAIQMQEGYKGFWRGNAANVYKIFPESGIRFMSYEGYKKVLFAADPSQPLTPMQKLLAGGLAGMTSQVTIYPLELIRSRLVVSHAGVFHGIQDVFWQTIRKEGVLALYKGIWPSLLGIFPYAAIDLAVYDVLKTLHLKSNNNKELPMTTMLMFGAISSSLGQLEASYPLDLVRRRLQIQGIASQMTSLAQAPNTQPTQIATYSGAMDVLKQTIQKEGFTGLYRGMTPNLLKVVPAVSISYVVYEAMKKQLDIP